MLGHKHTKWRTQRFQFNFLLLVSQSQGVQAISWRRQTAETQFWFNEFHLATFNSISSFYDKITRTSLLLEQMYNKGAILISLVLDSFQHSLFILRHMSFGLLFAQHVKIRSWGTIEFCFESVKVIKVIKVITQQHIFPVSIFQSHLEMKPRGNYQGCLLLWSKRG